MTQKEIVTAISRGLPADRDRLFDFLCRNAGIVQNLQKVARRYTDKPEDIKDVIQDCLFDFNNKIIDKSVKEPEKWENLLMSMARNKAIDKLRKVKNKVVSIDDYKLKGKRSSTEETFSLEDEIVQNDVEQALASVFEKEIYPELTPICSEMIRITRTTYLTSKEIALQLGVSIKTVEKRRENCKKKMRALLLKSQIVREILELY